MTIDTEIDLIRHAAKTAACKSIEYAKASDAGSYMAGVRVALDEIIPLFKNVTAKQISRSACAENELRQLKETLS